MIELLVVISIIGILASMLLPSLSRAKEKAHIATCLNNLHQIGISLKLYVDDHNDKFPPAQVTEPATGRIKSTRATLGGRDPIARVADYYPTAAIRPLYGYLRPSEVFRCPVDKGQGILPCPRPPLKPSNWALLGCSYQYNAGSLTVLSGGGFRHPPADSLNGLAEKTEGWVPSPELYILMHEPPARLYGCANTPPQWYQWHYVRGASDIEDPVTARREFYSPVLFVDGHTAAHNFTPSLADNLYYPYEPTREWIWYKAVDETTAPQKP